jgi:hypothetical protein
METKNTHKGPRRPGFLSSSALWPSSKTSLGDVPAIALA